MDRAHALVYGGHDPAVCVRCINAIGHLMQGKVAPSEAMSLDGLSFAGTVEHLPDVAHAQAYRAELCHINGNAEETERRARAVLEIAAPRGMAHYVAWATIALGWCLARRGEDAVALTHVEEGMAALRAAKNLYQLPHRLTQRAEALAACGRVCERAMPSRRRWHRSARPANGGTRPKCCASRRAFSLVFRPRMRPAS